MFGARWSPSFTSSRSLLPVFPLIQNVPTIDGLPSLRDIQDPGLDQILGKLEDDAVTTLCRKNVDCYWQVFDVLGYVGVKRCLSDWG
jgi:hypothetical protein